MPHVWLEHLWQNNRRACVAVCVNFPVHIFNAVSRTSVVSRFGLLDVTVSSIAGNLGGASSFQVRSASSFTGSKGFPEALGPASAADGAGGGGEGAQSPAVLHCQSLLVRGW